MSGFIACFQNGETVSSAGITLSGSMAFNGSASASVKNVGAYTMDIGTLAMSSTTNNYTMTFSNPTPNNYVITTKAITVTAVANTKTYDQTATAAAVPTISPAPMTMRLSCAAPLTAPGSCFFRI